MGKSGALLLPFVGLKNRKNGSALQKAVRFSQTESSLKSPPSLDIRRLFFRLQHEEQLNTVQIHPHTYR